MKTTTKKKKKQARDDKKAMKLGNALTDVKVFYTNTHRHALFLYLFHTDEACFESNFGLALVSAFRIRSLEETLLLAANYIFRVFYCIGCLCRAFYSQRSQKVLEAVFFA